MFTRNSLTRELSLGHPFARGGRDSPASTDEDSGEASKSSIIGSSTGSSPAPILPSPPPPPPNPPAVPSKADHRSAPDERPPVQHTYSLNTSSNLPWLTVKLRNWAPHVKSIPIYFEGQSITGLVELDLGVPDRIKAVVVYVRGHAFLTGYESKNFLLLSDTLWDSSMGDPRSVGYFISQGQRYNGKLYGQYCWRFSIDLPRALSLSPRHERELKARDGERMPPSFGSRASNPCVYYELTVEVKRHTFRCDNSLTIPIGYTIFSRPTLSYPLRQYAYGSEAPLPCTEAGDSEWKSFSEIRLRGILSKAREVALSCTFAIASPLSYPRGTNIPCMLVIQSEVREAVEAVATPLAPRVLLRRRLETQSDDTDAGAFDVSPVNESNPLSRASWSPAREVPGNGVMHCRVIRGELGLPASITPSFSFGKTSLKYFVDLHPFDTPGFESSSADRLLRVEVAIVSFSAPAKASLRKSLPPLPRTRTISQRGRDRIHDIPRPT